MSGRSAAWQRTWLGRITVRSKASFRLPPLSSFSIAWGICFSLEANPRRLKAWGFCHGFATVHSAVKQSDKRAKGEVEERPCLQTRQRNSLKSSKHRSGIERAPGLSIPELTLAVPVNRFLAVAPPHGGRLSRNFHQSVSCGECANA
jgi:hypothetical protein